MAILRPQMENRLTRYIPPKGEFETFRDEDHYKEMTREWGLSTTKEAKKEFWYKEKTYQRLVTIKGFEAYGKTDEYNTLVIEFQDGNLSCIHPAFLKEMQQSSFGKESIFKDEEKEDRIIEQNKEQHKTETKQANPPESQKTNKAKPRKEKVAKLELPVEKAHFTANVKQFAMTYNPFTEANDEVVILENVRIEHEPSIDLEFAWCSHSKTVKKYELIPGDILEFDGKVAAKKLPKGKDVQDDYILDVVVLYKINNPSKIVKFDKSDRRISHGEN